MDSKGVASQVFEEKINENELNIDIEETKTEDADLKDENENIKDAHSLPEIESNLCSEEFRLEEIQKRIETLKTNFGSKMRKQK